jgi:hypothetical protein
MAKKSQSQGINNIWMLTREYDSLAGAGGVKDVSRQVTVLWTPKSSGLPGSLSLLKWT